MSSSDQSRKAVIRRIERKKKYVEGIGKDERSSLIKYFRRITGFF